MKNINSKITTNRGGLIKTVLFVVAILIVLGYFGFNLRNIIASPVVHDNLIYVKELVVTGWNNYMEKPVTYVWDNFFRPLIWTPFFGSLERLQKDQPAPASATP